MLLLRQRPPPVPVGFCPPRRRRWGSVSGSFLEREPSSPTSVPGWVVARPPQPSRTVELGTSFYSQGELWPTDTDGFIPLQSITRSRGLIKEGEWRTQIVKTTRMTGLSFAEPANLIINPCFAACQSILATPVLFIHRPEVTPNFAIGGWVGCNGRL